jgi:flagellar motor switch protein FliN/FliY
MSVLKDIPIEMSIVLGSTDLPIRGAMIPLDSDHNAPSAVYVNNKLVAEGKILVDGDQMSLEITNVIQRQS